MRKPHLPAVQAAWIGIFAALLPWSAPPACAEMVLSQVVLDIRPEEPSREDIEVWNTGPERIYVAAEPAEIRSAGTIFETRVTNVDPTVSGLLVTPQRLILDPGQRRIVRVATVLPRGATDRIYRVTIKPVAGPLSARVDALKVFVGYDVLVLQRPSQIVGSVTAQRSEHKITFKNESNTAQELFEGKQCDSLGQNCRTLPANRIYAGTSWEVPLSYDTPVEYRVSDGNQHVTKKF